MLASRSIFLRKFFYEPDKIGSVTPSSSYLTKKMLADLPWERLKVVVELGAGTGVFTEYIAQHKRADCQVIVIEQDKVMLERLERRFPDFLFGRQAENLTYILEKYALPQADCIISGLPFALFSPDLRERILSKVKASLKSEGQFIAFQYSLQMYRSFRKIFTEIKLGWELRNFPPAFVYYCKF